MLTPNELNDLLDRKIFDQAPSKHSIQARRLWRQMLRDAVEEAIEAAELERNVDGGTDVIQLFRHLLWRLNQEEDKPAAFSRSQIR